MDGSQLLQSPELVELPDLAVPTKAKRIRWSWRQILAGACALIALAGVGVYGHYYWTTGRFLVSTDDATVQADSVIISPKVPGYLSAVLVQDNQPVLAGQVLARIDDADYRSALAAVQAGLAADQATVQGLQNQIGEQQATVVQARATVAADQAAQTFAQQQYSRYATLAQNGAGTVLNAQQWQAGILEE
jgi:membrane fusion protein (multidrug efflux system)